MVPDAAGGRCHFSGYGKQAPGPAYELVEKALRLADEVDDRTYLFDAWDLFAQVQVSQGFPGVE